MVVAAGVTLGPPAQAAAPDTTDALVAVESEVLALVELGAFPQPIPQKLREVADEWRSSVEGYSRSDLVDWLHFSDEDAAHELDLLQGSADLSPDASAALRRLPEDAVRAVEAGQQIAIPASVYEHALNDLEYRSGSAPSKAGPPPDPNAAPAGVAVSAPPAGTASGGAPPGGAPPTSGPVAEVPATDVPATEVPATTTIPATAGTGAGSSEDGATPSNRAGTRPASSAALVGAVAGGVLLAAILVAGAVVVRRRRRPVADPMDNAVAHLLDASRRFSSSVAVADIHRILLEETIALTGADDAAVVTVEADGDPVVVAETSAGSIVPMHLDRGVVRRVLDTGVGVRSVAADLAIAGGSNAVLLVPLVRGGSIAGAVVALRSADRPFEATALDVLGQLAPMAAAALVSAGLHDNVAELSLTDGLTELGNRRRLDRDLVQALGAGAGTVGFVMVDIDHFKQFNDTHGHVAGDGVLQGVAALLRGAVRSGDVVYRYGGEEFCVLLPDATSDEAADVSERLRLAVEAHDFPGGETQPNGRVTISVGTTVASRIDPTEVKERADHALYEAKHRGRNQVVVESIVVEPTDPTGPTAR